MKRRILLTVVALVLAIGMLLTGCAAQTPTGTAMTVLRVGIDNTYPPMEFTDDSGNTVGFDIDLANAIAAKLNVKVEYVPTAWKSIFTGLDTNKYDCIISSLSITDERKKTILFSQPYISNAQVVVVPPSNTTITTPENLKDKIVGVQIGTTAEAAGTTFQKTIPFEMKTYDQVIQPFAELKTGRIDAIIVDEVVARYYINKESASYKLSGIKLPPEPIGIGFKLSDTALQAKVEKIITDMKADGSLGTISKKWFGVDITNNLT
ncbi:MAG: ABC transporter substrate-binding protein [Clostridia bacterium]